MTYRKDSDVWYPYNQIEYVGAGLYQNLDKIWESKTKEAAWVASNCLTDNRRTDMVHLLEEKGLQVPFFLLFLNFCLSINFSPFSCR